MRRTRAFRGQPSERAREAGLSAPGGGARRRRACVGHNFHAHIRAWHGGVLVHARAAQTALLLIKYHRSGQCSAGGASRARGRASAATNDPASCSDARKPQIAPRRSLEYLVAIY